MKPSESDALIFKNTPYAYQNTFPFLTNLLGLRHALKIGMWEVCHSVSALMSLGDRYPCPNLKAKTHPDHRTALIQTQQSGFASPKGI